MVRQEVHSHAQVQGQVRHIDIRHFSDAQYLPLFQVHVSLKRFNECPHFNKHVKWPPLIRPFSREATLLLWLFFLETLFIYVILSVCLPVHMYASIYAPHTNIFNCEPNPIIIGKLKIYLIQ